MLTDTSLRALQDVSPRNQPGFDDWLERLDALRPRITATTVPARRRLPLSAAAAVALAAAAVVAVVTFGAASPQSADAAARKALAMTAAASSGTITGTVSHNGSTYTLDTTRWNRDSIAVTPGDRSELGPNQALTLIDGAAYVEQADGTWLHYASADGVGPKVGPQVELAENNVAGNTADQILSLATGLTQTSQSDGTTVYTGTIPSTSDDKGTPPSDDEILRIISSLSSGDDTGLQLQLTVGADDLVRQIELTTGGTYTWTVTYSRLGRTPPITAPATSTPAPPVIWSPGTPCTTPCGG